MEIKQTFKNTKNFNFSVFDKIDFFENKISFYCLSDLFFYVELLVVRTIVQCLFDTLCLIRIF